MILIVKHADIDPTAVAQAGRCPGWFEAIKSLVDWDSSVEPGYMKLIGDDKNFKTLRTALETHLPQCRILRMIPASEMATR